MLKISFPMLAAMAVLTSAGLAQENYTTNWSGHRTLAVNTAPSGANVTGNVRNFPLLVRLGAADSAVFIAAKAAGADLRFTKANNTTRLKHQIERWDATGRKAEIWVLLDTVYGGTSSQQFRMHWGNAGAMDSSNGAAVFDTAMGYQAVWHMNGATASPELDATVNAFHATPGGTPESTADTAIIGLARRFGGSNTAPNNDFLRVEGSASGKLNFPSNGRYTITAWARPTHTATGNRTIIGKHDRKYNLKLTNAQRWEAVEHNNNFGTFVRPSNPNMWSWQGASHPVDLYVQNQWVHLMSVRDSIAQRLYVDGVLTATNPGTDSANYTGFSATTSTVNDSIVVIGRQPENTNRYFQGQLDEIRMSNVARSADYAKLSYETQKAGASVVVELSAVANLRYLPGTTAADTIVFQTGVAYNIVPTYTGGPVDSIKITSNTTTLPAGLSLNIFTGVLSGTPTATFAAANRTFTAYSALGNTTRVVRVSAVPGPTMNLTYAPDTTTYPVGLAVVNGPTWSGRAPTKFAVSAGALPAGLVLDSVTGVISGTPTAQAAAANFTVRATNTTGPDTATKVLRFTIGAPEDFNTWAQHQTLWLNTQSNGANVLKLVRQFPVLVRLDSTFNFAQAASGGADLRFSKADNATRLPHQIDHWDSAGKRAGIWVLVDSIPATSIKSIRMHWGKAGAPSTSSGPAVFRLQDGFRAVWHMNGATDTSNEPDATANGMTATQTGGPLAAAGIIGGARSFVNTGTTVSDYMRVLGSATTLNMPAGGNYSVSAWANLSNTQTHATLLSKHDLTYALKLNSGSSWEFFEYNESWNSVTGPAGETGVWYHLIGVQNGLDAAFYANGVRIDFGISPVSGTGARNEAFDVVIGAEPTSNTAQRRPFGGLADEIRIAAVSRDTAWAKLEYENQRPTGQTLVSFTQPVSIGAGVAARAVSFGFTAKPQGEGVLFQVQGAGESMKTHITLVDMFGRTVWSRTLAASGSQDILWNGQANNGTRVSSGVYVVRAALLNASGKATQTVERKLPLTR